MKTRVLFLLSFAVLGVACGKNSEKSKAATPAQLSQMNIEERRQATFNFLQECRVLKRVIPDLTDPSILAAKLKIKQDRGYKLKIALPYGGFERLTGVIRPSDDYRTLFLSGVGRMDILKEQRTGAMCGLLTLRPDIRANLPQRKLMICEELGAISDSCSEMDEVGDDLRHDPRNRYFEDERPRRRNRR